MKRAELKKLINQTIKEAGHTIHPKELEKFSIKQSAITKSKDVITYFHDLFGYTPKYELIKDQFILFKIQDEISEQLSKIYTNRKPPFEYVEAIYVDDNHIVINIKLKK